MRLARILTAASLVAVAACSGSSHHSSLSAGGPATAAPTSSNGAGASTSPATAAGTPAPTGGPTASGAPGSGAPGSGAAGSGAPGSGAPAAGAPATPPPAISADWPTYHRTNDRAGNALGATRPSKLSKRWEAGLDGAVYGQPLVVGGMILAATENDTVYALDAASGSVRWRSHLATPVARAALQCGNIDPLGITGTPAYDPATGSLFVVTEATGGVHTLVALDVRTGRTRFTRNLDVTTRDRLTEQERGALAVANGRVYIPFGGLYGDCGDYVGYVAAVATDGSGSVAHYEVPTAREGGIWAPPGPSVGADGAVFVAVGNGEATSGAYDGSDAVVKLAADLSRRVDFFAPKSWASENASDADLGSTGPLLLPGNLAVIAGKGDTAYLVDTGHLGGIGGQVASFKGCTGFGGMAADGSVAFLPCSEGVTRVDVSGRALHVGWKAPSSITGTPVVGGGAVWTLDTGGGVLHVLDEGSGAELASISVGAVTRFTSPTVVGSSVFVGTSKSVVAITAA